MKNIIAKLKAFSTQFWEEEELHEPTKAETEYYQRSNTTMISAMYIPHENQYSEVLALVEKDDVVIDMGSGDFRFPLLLSEKVKKVYALELNPELVSKALDIIGYHIPTNLIVICTDWFHFPIPYDVNVIICLCNSPKIPDFWYMYKLIVGTTQEIKMWGKIK